MIVADEGMTLPSATIFIEPYALLATSLVDRRFPFWAKTQSILRQNALHFAAKRTPFWAKTHSILGQNALYFGPKRRAFITIRIIGQATPMVYSVRTAGFSRVLRGNAAGLNY